MHTEVLIDRNGFREALADPRALLRHRDAGEQRHRDLEHQHRVILDGPRRSARSRSMHVVIEVQNTARCSEPGQEAGLFEPPGGKPASGPVMLALVILHDVVSLRRRTPRSDVQRTRGDDRPRVPAGDRNGVSRITAGRAGTADARLCCGPGVPGGSTPICRIRIVDFRDDTYRRVVPAIRQPILVCRSRCPRRGRAACGQGARQVGPGQAIRFQERAHVGLGRRGSRRRQDGPRRR